MLITQGQRKELILYWFQAFDKTSAGTLLQKIHTFWTSFRYHREDNAFVRVSIPIHNQTKQEAFSTGIRFIEAFYPTFLEYIKES